MVKVKDIAKAIEEFAPRSLQESYDNAGLQVGDPEMQVSAVLLCLDVTPEILAEAKARECNLIVSHHPLIFRGLKQLTGADTTQRTVMQALRDGIAIYAAHTNLDSVPGGVSFEMAHKLGLTELSILAPSAEHPGYGLGVVGTCRPTPKLEFLRRVKDTFGVEELKYSGQSPTIVVRRVALCGGSGGSFIRDAIGAGADLYITGDLKYHDFTDHGQEILLADIGHYESELCSRQIFSRIIGDALPGCVVYTSGQEQNPIKYL